MRSIWFCQSPSEYLWRVGKSLMSSDGRAERRDLSHLPLGEEPISDPTLIEHLDRARVKTAGPRAGEHMVGAPLDDRDVDPRQRQLSRQHHPRRTASGDHHRMLAHGHTPVGYVDKNPSTSLLHFRSFWLAAGDYAA